MIVKDGRCWPNSGGFVLIQHSSGEADVRRLAIDSLPIRDDVSLRFPLLCPGPGNGYSDKET